MGEKGRGFVESLPLLALGLLVVVALPAASAVTVEDLQGELSLEDLQAPEGMDAASERADAFFVPADGEAETEGSLSGHADEAAVNWTHVTRHSSYRVGDRPLTELETSNETSQETYGEVSLASQLVGSEAEMLVLPQDGSAMQVAVETDGPAQARPAQEDVWRVGERSDEAGAGAQDVRVFEEDATKPGEPLVEATGAVEATLSGDLTVYLWGANVTVEADDGGEAYRSGYWTENETRDPATGRTVASEEHYQLLRLRLTDATLTFSQSAGEAQWTADRVTAETDGPVSYTVEEGSLVADEHRFSLTDDTVSLRGQVSHELSTSAAEGVLESRVEADRAQVGAFPDPGDDGSGPWSWLALLVAGAAVGVVAIGPLSGKRVRVVSRSQDPEGSKPSLAQLRVQAEEALQANEPARARDAAETLIEADVDVLGAWSIVAASYLQEGRAERVLDEVVPNIDPADLEGEGDAWTRASFAYLIAHAHVRVGEEEACWPWVEQAAEVASVREKLETAPVFEPLREDERFDAVVDEAHGSDDDPDPAYR